MNDRLFNAILSMDVYNRGYNENILLNNENAIDQTIGNATIISESDIETNSTAVQKNFYALAYSINGDTIVSYRGTDDPAPIVSGGDILEGWVVGLGVLEDNQAGLAIEFYKNVAMTVGGESVDYQTVNISTTGHSLGGGLASYISALYGQAAESFDAMPFTIASSTTVFRTTHYNVEWVDASNVTHTDQLDYDTLQAYLNNSEITVTSSSLIDPILKQLVYETDDVNAPNNTWDQDVTNITGAYIDGEALTEPRNLVSPLCQPPFRSPVLEL